MASRRNRAPTRPRRHGDCVKVRHANLALATDSFCIASGLHSSRTKSLPTARRGRACRGILVAVVPVVTSGTRERMTIGPVGRGCVDALMRRGGRCVLSAPDDDEITRPVARLEAT